MRYRMILINTDTNQKEITMIGFTNKKDAIEWATQWRSTGRPFDCKIWDDKKREIVKE